MTEKEKREIVIFGGVMKQICINLLLQKNNISFIERISMKYLIVIILLILLKKKKAGWNWMLWKKF